MTEGERGTEGEIGTKGEIWREMGTGLRQGVSKGMARQGIGEGFIFLNPRAFLPYGRAGVTGGKAGPCRRRRGKDGPAML